jgi:hypothetical protein
MWAKSGCDHCADIHIYDEHRGLAHRCRCGTIVRLGFLVGTCETCNRLLSNPEIVGVEPISVSQIHRPAIATRDDRQLAFSFCECFHEQETNSE